MCKKKKEFICPSCEKEYKNYNGLSIHYNKIHNGTSEELYIKFHLNGIRPVCRCGCGKYTKFRDGTHGFRQYYSKKCKHNHTTVLKKCPVCNIEFKSYISENKEFCSTDCVNNSKEVVSKRQKTNLKRYGVKNVLESDIFLERIKENNIKKYDVEWYVETEEFQKKFKKTSQKKYGVDHHFSSDKIIDKIKKTNLERYGVENPKQSDEVQRKSKLDYYKKLFNTDRLKEKVKPLFSFDDFDGARKEYKYKFQCFKCDNIFKDHLQDGRIPRCYECYPIGTNVSKAEGEIQDFLNSMDIDYEPSKRGILSGRKELDIYIPDHRLAIEFNGLLYHSENYGGINNKYHLNKTIECERKNIQLIHIFEDEWNYKQDIVKNMLRHKLNKTKQKVYARKCIIKDVAPDIKNEFLNRYHIQGEDRSNIKIGLYHEDILFAVMTFKQLKKDIYELSRYSTQGAVVGGASKLFKHFISSYNINEVISFADRRYSNGNLYNILGFTKKYHVEPSYWYMESYGERIYKSHYRKEKIKEKLDIYDPNLTEWENMQLNGFDRIWDCGLIKYKWSK